jgi:hypothetical protein
MALVAGSASALEFNKLTFTPLKAGEKVAFASGTVTASRLEILETGKKPLPVTCTSGIVSKGELTGPTTLTMTVALRGCSATAGKCTSTGGAEGEIVTGALEGLLGTLKLAEGKAGLDAKNATAVAEFACGTTKIKITGGVVGGINAISKAGKTKLSMAYSQKEGVQKDKSLFNGGEDKLVPTIGEAKGESVGLQGKINVVINEAIAIK